jgi:hypothetical protein
MHDGEHWAVQSRSQDACRCLVACFWQSLAMLCVLAPFPRFKLAAPSLLVFWRLRLYFLFGLRSQGLVLVAAWLLVISRLPAGLAVGLCLLFHISNSFTPPLI